MNVSAANDEGGPLGLIFAKAGKLQRAGSGWLGKCPAHGDRTPSLSIGLGDDGRVLLSCKAGCSAERVVEAWGLKLGDLFPPRSAPLAALPALGCTLDDMAHKTRLPRDVLVGLGWTDAEFHGHACVDIPYERSDGTVHRVRVRRSLSGDKRFAWREGSGTIAYFPDHGAFARDERYLIVAEGETDVVVLLYAGLPALGCPGANATHTLDAEHVAGVERVFVVRETDPAGETFVAGARERLSELGFRGEVFALPMPDKAKDPCALWVREPDVEAFHAKMRAAMREAVEGPRPAYRLVSEMVADCLRPVGQRLRTGLPTLDATTRGGIPLARVAGILGAPGSGKSTLGVQLFAEFEQQGCACAFLAADEPSDGIVTRLGQRAGYSRDALESEGEAGDAVRAGFARRCEGRPLTVIDPDADESMRTIEDAERALLHMAADRPRVLVVDSLQTAQCKAADAAESQRERIDAKLSVLKAIAKRGTLVIFISEMARSGYRTGDKNTDTSALAAGKESGSIEYGAALLLGLRSVRGEHGLVDVEVAKNRLGGSKPEFRLALDFDTATFAEVAMPDSGDELSVKQARFSKLRADIVDAVRTQRLSSASQVFKVVKGTRGDVLAEVKAMLADGQLVQLDDGVLRVGEAVNG